MKDTRSVPWRLHVLWSLRAMPWQHRAAALVLVTVAACGAWIGIPWDRMRAPDAIEPSVPVQMLNHAHDSPTRRQAMAATAETIEVAIGALVRAERAKNADSACATAWLEQIARQVAERCECAPPVQRKDVK